MAEPPVCAPTPYTAEQIREANPPGTWRTYRITRQGCEPVLRRTTFVAPDGTGATLVSVIVDAQGSPRGEPQRITETWEGFRDHAAYPAATTEISEASIEVEAGRFACKRYTVTEVTPDYIEVSQAWFAHDAPGPPVALEVVRDGVLLTRMELLAHGRAN